MTMEVDASLTQHEELLTALPTSELPAPPPALQRCLAAYESRDAPFFRSGHNYEMQYAQLYFFRLQLMRPRAVAAASLLWPGTPVLSVMSAPEEGEVAVAGTLYKEQRLKPTILDEYLEDEAAQNALGRARFVSGDDRLVLEDESARIALSRESTGLDAGSCVSGIVVALRGVVQANGELLVTHACFAGTPPDAGPPPIPRAPPSSPPPKFLALVSGLGVGSARGDPLNLQLLADYLAGSLGTAAEQKKAQRIVRLVVAGGLLAAAPAAAAPSAAGGSLVAPRVAAPPARLVEEADSRLAELAAALPLDLMPGPRDPTPLALPQQPLAGCLLPRARRCPALTRSPNPHAFALEGVGCWGTSGQNVEDVLRYCTLERPVDVLEAMLRWGHAAPTAPDTLPAYPYHEADPLVLDAAPHLFFAGGQPRFESRLVQHPGGGATRVVAVPEFYKCPCLVLVNLQTLECEPVYFGEGMEAGKEEEP